MLQYFFGCTLKFVFYFFELRSFINLFGCFIFFKRGFFWKKSDLANWAGSHRLDLTLLIKYLKSTKKHIFISEVRQPI